MRGLFGWGLVRQRPLIEGQEGLCGLKCRLLSIKLLLVWLYLLKRLFSFTWSQSRAFRRLEILRLDLLKSTEGFSHFVRLLSTVLLDSFPRFWLLSFNHCLKIGQRSLGHLKAKFKQIRGLTLCKLYWIGSFQCIRDLLFLSFFWYWLSLQSVRWLLNSCWGDIVLAIFHVTLFDCWVLLYLKREKSSFNPWDR